jgi:hypothetical protein
MRTELVTTSKRKATRLESSHSEQRLRLREGIARGERAFAEGRVLTQAQARRRMSRWLKLTR